MDFDDIDLVVIIVQLKDGRAHQVLSTSENKNLALRMLIGFDNGKLTLDKELYPVEFKIKT